MNLPIGNLPYEYRMDKYINTLSDIVEPPRKGRFGEMAYVPCREVVPISEVCLFFHCITPIHVCFQYIMNYLQTGLVMITVSSESSLA